MGEVEPPGDQRNERGPRGRRDRRRGVVADQRDPDRAAVEPLRVGADDRPRDPAVAALEDLAVLVDEEVVADVVPAVALHVVELDRPHDRGRLGLSSTSSTPAVWWTIARWIAVRVVRRRAADRLVGVPVGARDDRRRACQLEPLRTPPRSRGLRTKKARTRETRPSERYWIAFEAPVHCGSPDAPARASTAPLAAAAIGQRVLVVREQPGAPAAGQAARAVLDAARPAPVQADELEVPGRERATRQPAAGALAAARARPRGRCRETRRRGRLRRRALHRTDPLREKQTPSSPARKTAARR